MTEHQTTALADGLTVAWTDGSCIGNPGPGGWAYLIQTPEGTVTTRYGHVPDTTNVRQEMTAVCKALEATSDAAETLLYTDCMMIVQGVTDWLPGWKINGFKKSNKKPVANRDLWEHMDDLLEGRDVRFEHVKAHTGIAGNEAVDTLALKGAHDE